MPIVPDEMKIARMIPIFKFVKDGNLLWGSPGSILGPLFFLLYINDINNASSLLNLILFADDTNVFMSHKDPDYLSDMLNLEMGKLLTWFKANKLSLNLKKRLKLWTVIFK